jgi:hypothetical protein
MTGIRRALLPALLAAAALTCAFAIHRSLACPIPPPQPLRTLYKVSDRVVVARVGAKEVLKTVNQLAFVRVALHVTENVKGAPVQLVHLYDTEFVGAEAEKDEEQVTVKLFYGRTVPRLKRGERYLFFLDRREEGDGYAVDDQSYGIKQLSGDDLKVYLERMKELADLTRQQPEDKHALVEWLVRCAEEPATRWEGAYELSESADAVTRGDKAEAKEEQGASGAGRAQAAAEASDASGAGEAQAAPEPQASDDPAAVNITDEQIERLQRINELRYAPADPTLVPLLNAVQKQRLSDAFLASSSEPNEGDDLLMQVVKEFGDPRFPGFVLARLHRFENEAPYQAELWLRALTASLKNEQLIELAASYTQDATYYEWGEEEQTEAEPPADAAGDGTGGEEVSDEEVEEETVDPKVAAALEAAAAERATLKRSATLKAILTRVDLFVSTGQLAEAQP